MFAALTLSLCLGLPGASASPLAAPGAQAAIGETAPSFTLLDLQGASVSLESFRGKTVVLEWFNPGCPYVVHAYEEGPLKTLAGEQSEEIVWLNINSGAQGKQGASPEQNQQAQSQWSIAQPILLDPSGDVGRAYQAKTTPHMMVIDPEGKLRYQGALDNAPRGKHSGDYQPYLESALAALARGEPVEPETTKAYGCSVKYGK